MELLEKGARGNVSLAAQSDNNAIYSLPVHKLTINAPFQTTEKGVLSPAFDSTSAPQFIIEWQVPETMRLMLLVSIYADYSKASGGDQYLAAFDKVGRAFRLPISNLYGDCRLCHGKYTEAHNTSLDLLRAAWTQFHKSSWNRDLYNDSSSTRRDATKKMFSFIADNESFKQLPISGDWSELCEKVGSEFLIQNAAL
jgi:hypothetical protein